MSINVFTVKEAEEIGILFSELFPEVELVPRGKMWLLKDDARFCIDLGGKWISVVVPAGFASDLDSVPRIPVVYTWLKGRTVRAALLHDVLYRLGLERALADKAFLKAMKLEGVRHRYRYPIYWGVRMFGGKYYKRAPLKDLHGQVTQAIARERRKK